jgi:hypothetical protein
MILGMAWAVAFISATQIVSDAYRYFDEDYGEGDLVPDKWISWGTCRPLSRLSEHTFRYFHMKLPFAKFKMVYWGEREALCQLVLQKFGGTWRLSWWEIR